MQHINERPVAGNKAKVGRLSLRIKLNKRPGQRCTWIKNVLSLSKPLNYISSIGKQKRGKKSRGVEWKGGEWKRKTHKRVTKTLCLMEKPESTWGTNGNYFFRVKNNDLLWNFLVKFIRRKTTLNCIFNANPAQILTDCLQK